MFSDLQIIRQLGEHEDWICRMASKLELMHREAEAAPSEAELKTRRYMFHRFSREYWRASIARMTATLAELMVLVNDIKRRYYPERTTWDGPLSNEWANAVRDSQIDRLVEEDRERTMAKNHLARLRMADLKTRRNPGRPLNDGIDRLLTALAS